jgi:hypothetical protein
MKLKVANRNSGLKAMMSSVLMLSLSLMLLVFSCPLKKMLISGTTHTPAVRTNQTNQPQKNNGDQNLAINSCLVKKDGKLVKFTVAKEIKSFPRVVPNQSFHFGTFPGIYYLSATIRLSVTGDPVSSSLPLFLRHSSLLI